MKNSPVFTGLVLIALLGFGGLAYGGYRVMGAVHTIQSMRDPKNAVQTATQLGTIYGMTLGLAHVCNLPEHRIMIARLNVLPAARALAPSLDADVFGRTVDKQVSLVSNAKLPPQNCAKVDDAVSKLEQFHPVPG